MGTTENRQVIRLEASHSISDAERLLAQIHSAGPGADLLASTDLKDHYFAGTAAYMQLLISWCRYCPEGRLRVHVQENDGEHQARAVLERFLKKDYGALALALAGGIWTRGGERQLTDLARPLLDRRLEEMDDRRKPPWKGPKLYAMCLDESWAEAPGMLYRPRESGAPEPEVLGLENFQWLARGISERLAAGSGGGSLASSGSLSSMLFELFRNTHSWARADAGGKPYGPSSSARGFRVQRHDLKVADEEQIVSSLPPLKDFFSHSQLAPGVDRRHFAEVTVFDSGPGLAARWRGAPVERAGDLEAEHSDVRACLRKHFSTSIEEGKGKGLHRVLQDLTALSAFLWLRCGRLSLYRDFFATPYDPEHAADEPFLLDWTGGIGGPTAAPLTAGTFFTALIPIGKNFRQETLLTSK